MYKFTNFTVLILVMSIHSDNVRLEWYMQQSCFHCWYTQTRDTQMLKCLCVNAALCWHTNLDFLCQCLCVINSENMNCSIILNTHIVCVLGHVMFIKLWVFVLCSIHFHVTHCTCLSNYWCTSMYKGCPNSHNQRGSYCLWWISTPFQITVLFLWTRTVIYFPSKSLYEAFLLTHSSSLTYWLTHFLSLSLSYSYSVVLPSYLKWVFSARLSAWALMLTHNGAWLNSLYQVKFLVCVPFYRTRRALSVSQISPLTINVQCYSL